MNTSKSNSISYSDNKQFGGMLQLNRKLGNRGRNVTLRGDFSYKDGDSKSLSTNNVHLYQIKMKDNPLADSTYQTNRYNVTPTKSAVIEVYVVPTFRFITLDVSCMKGFAAAATGSTHWAIIWSGYWQYLLVTVIIAVPIPFP